MEPVYLQTLPGVPTVVYIHYQDLGSQCGEAACDRLWVLGESLKLDAWGSQVPAEDQLFYWYGDTSSLKLECIMR